MDKEKKIVFWLLLVFFIVRIGVACFIGRGIVPGSDAIEYNAYALTILKDFRWLNSSEFIASHREPVYPLFLAITYFFFGKENFIAVYILQALINTLTVFIIYKFALKIFAGKTAFIALVYSGLYAFYFWFTATLLREVLVCFLVISFIYLLYVYLIESSSKIKLVTVALVFTLLIHTDSRYIYFLPVILLLFMFYKYFWQADKIFAIFIFLVLIFSLPWSIRNTITYNKIFLGHIFCLETGQNLPKIKMRGEYEGYKRLATGAKGIIFPKNPNYPTDEERKLIQRGLNPLGRSAAEINAIRKGIYPASSFWGKKWFNLRELWRPFMLSGVYNPLPGKPQGNVFQHWSLRHNLFSIVFYGTLLPFMLIGIIVLAIQKQKIIYFLLMPLFFHTLFHTMIWGELRYRVQIDSILIILGAYGISIAYRFGRNKGVLF